MSLCAKCGEREGTMDFVAEGGVLAYVHGMYQRWCRLCVVREQLAYAKARAADIPSLEAELAELENPR